MHIVVSRSYSGLSIFKVLYLLVSPLYVTIISVLSDVSLLLVSKFLLKFQKLSFLPSPVVVTAIKAKLE